MAAKRKPRFFAKVILVIGMTISSDVIVWFQMVRCTFCLTFEEYISSIMQKYQRTKLAGMKYDGISHNHLHFSSFDPLS